MRRQDKTSRDINICEREQTTDSIISKAHHQRVTKYGIVLMFLFCSHRGHQ
ncbi:hypothetical protein BXY39_0442 [Eilatimonas milleporae]|uniref:Uncharacterized protein n=1 Tax=Eilatimonas milleporae TaxID=911205 RepID=A0A3M0CQV6_9PROT|nr:hypothetical protein BXY39_0442 [Eilatimonas milleporae]